MGATESIPAPAALRAGIAYVSSAMEDERLGADPWAAA